MNGNRPFPISLVPLFQNESKCENHCYIVTIHCYCMKVSLICMKMNLLAELISIGMVSHEDSF